MHDRKVSIWTAIVTGLALVALFLLAGSVAAISPGPTRVSSDSAPPSAGGTRIVSAASGWSSGWITITPGTFVTLTHDLGGDPDDYAVELWFMDTDDGGYGINVRAYGGLEAEGSYYGAFWQHLTNNTIQVVRSANDTFADYVRVRVWVPDPLPDYCSDWTFINPGKTLTFTHGLDKAPDELVVGMVFSSTARGINNFAYGGIELGPTDYRGAYWSHVDSSTVRVFRYPGLSIPAQVRVCVTRPDPPDYDSGWVTIAQGVTKTLTHNLHMNPNLYLIRLYSKSDDSSFGINSIFPMRPGRGHHRGRSSGDKRNNRLIRTQF